MRQHTYSAAARSGSTTGQPRFAMVPEAVATLLANKPILLACYCMHALLCDFRTRRSTATQARIGALIGRSIRTVRRVERQLSELGLVRRERLKRGRVLTLLDGTADTGAPDTGHGATADTRSPERPPYQTEPQQINPNDALARWSSYNAEARRVAAMPEGEAKQAARLELAAMLREVNRV